MEHVSSWIVDKRATSLLMFSPLSGTGEHGVGIGKREFLVHELGVGTVQLMRRIKQAIDPEDLFNPGKVSLSGTVPLFPPRPLRHAAVRRSGRCADGETRITLAVPVVSYDLYLPNPPTSHRVNRADISK